MNLYFHPSRSGLFVEPKCFAASASESQASQQTTTTSTQGGAGAGSNTIVSGGNTTYNDPALGELALQIAGALSQQAIGGAQGTTNQAITTLNSTQADVAAQEAQQASNNNALLQTVLANQSQLALSSQTGGASLTNSSTNYLIWGAIGVAAIALFGRKSA